MSGAAYTPGPWKVDSDDDVVSAAGDLIARVHGGYDDELIEEQAANATLIAAAPDLAYALAALVEFADEMTGRVEPEFRQIAYAREVLKRAGVS